MPSRSTPFPLLVAVLTGAAFVASLTQTLVVPILPGAPTELGITPSQASWLVTVTIITGAVASPLLGRLGDIYDRRTILMIAIGSFVVGSVLTAIGGGIWLLLIGRGIQGISVAAIPLGISVLASAAPPRRRALGIAVVSSMLGVGGAIGLPLAGVISAAWGFHGLFWIAAVIGTIVLVGIRVGVPPSPARHTRGGVDLVGSALLVIGLTALLLATGQAREWGAGAILMLALAILSLLVLGVVELRVDRPIIDVRLLRTRTILVTNITGVLTGFALFAGVLGPITLLQLPPGEGFDLNVAVAGLCMLPGGVVMAGLAPIAPRVIAAMGARAALAASGAVILAGFCAVLFLAEGLVPLIIATMLIFAGAAIAYTAMPSLILPAAPAWQSGEASGVNALARSVGSALASAAFGALAAGHAVTAETIDGLFVLGAAAAGMILVTALVLPTRGRGRAPL